MKYEYYQQYKGELQSDLEWMEQLNNFGKDGWELVTVVSETEHSFEKAYFKREYKGPIPIK